MTLYSTEMQHAPMTCVLDNHLLSLTECFFDTEHIKYSMHCMVSSSKLRSPENMLSVAKLMLCDTICMNFSETGFAPFRRDPSVEIPYVDMTKS